jgi:hypothetical protein
MNGIFKFFQPTYMADSGSNYGDIITVTVNYGDSAFNYIVDNFAWTIKRSQYHLETE